MEKYMWNYCGTGSGTVYLDSPSPNVIYLITCSRCSLQYAGMVGQKINERFNWYKACFQNPKNMTFIVYYMIISIKQCVKMF